MDAARRIIDTNPHATEVAFITHEFRMTPSAVRALPIQERAFMIAAYEWHNGEVR